VIFKLRRGLGSRWLLGATATLFALSTVAACDRTGDDPPPDDEPIPGADAYLAVLTSILIDTDDAPAGTDGTADEPSDPLPVVFLVALDGPLGIGDQAAIIQGFDTSHDIRFVDDLDAAVDDELPGRPPRDDALVLGVGTIAVQPPHLLRIEHYETEDRIDATLLTLEYDDGAWVVITAEPVPAESLTDVP
jgi:hypothetical protein